MYDITTHPSNPSIQSTRSSNLCPCSLGNVARHDCRLVCPDDDDLRQRKERISVTPSG